ncbi:MAG: response regulator [Vicinamibacterales bacterium]
MTADAPLVVIVEDDAFSALLFERTLTEHGYRVVISRGAEGEVPVLLGLRPAALLVDLHLGEMDGLQLLRRLRAVRSLRQVPAAVMTGDYFTDATVARELERLGVEMYLKPLWDADLLRVVGALVKRPTFAADLPAGRAHP